MALLNYADSLQEIKDFLNASSGTANYLKLAFTKDGHIITHGVDFTPDFTATTGPNGGRGLVKGSTNNPKEFLRGNNTWNQIAVSDLPYSDTLTNSDNNHIPTTKAVVDYIGTFIKGAETMRFMGVINYDKGLYNVLSSSGISQPYWPNICNIGDTYRIGTASDSEATFAGYKCESGDMLICIKDNNDNNISTNDKEYWAVIQTNINGTKETNINGTITHYYATDSMPVTIFAPTSQGLSGNILVGKTTSNAPVWGSLQITEDGKLHINDDNGLTLNFGTDIVAKKTTAQLEPGIGLNFDEGSTLFFDGSVQTKINLVGASTTNLGGVKIDTTHGTDNTPTISIDPYDSTIYITAENIKNALGYDPSGIYSIVNTEKEGYAPKIIIDSAELDSSYRVLASSADGTPNWFALPLTAFRDTQRDIQIGGESIGQSNLNFIPTGDIYLKADANNDDVVDLSFGLNWYNISTRTHEQDPYDPPYQ